jgi:hypothetical protein
VESNIGWIPTLLEQADDMYRRYRWWTGAHKEMSEMPSRIFHRNFWATFMVDRSGIELRHRMNVDHRCGPPLTRGSQLARPGLAIGVFEGVPRAGAEDAQNAAAPRTTVPDAAGLGTPRGRGWRIPRLELTRARRRRQKLFATPARTW